VANGADLRSLPLRERRTRLRCIMPAASSVVSETLSVESRGRELFELMCMHDLEGIVAKRLADPYQPRTSWFKIKNPN
jgi:bifunctional non-homologous end joining protein LigD